MDDGKLEILIIDDDEDDYIILHDMLKDIRWKGVEVEWLRSYHEANQELERDTWDVILVDYDLGSGNGLDLIRRATEKGIKAPLIMITGRGRYELDVEAMNSGAADYLTKNMINSDMLERVIRYSLERSRSKEILEQMVEERTLELQNALEELRVTEEELRTQHEELQATNEELETLNEELQATNEELETLNSEMGMRIGELSEAIAYLNSILASISSSVVVVNRDYLVEVWNPMSEELWGLRKEEALGQSFFSLDIGLPVEKLKRSIRSVLSGENGHEAIEVAATNRRGLAVQLQGSTTPLINRNHEISGVIIILELMLD